METSDYNISVFMDLSGIELTEDQIPAYSRAEARAFRFLENALGWSFNYTSTYRELGKTKTECSCPDGIEKMDTFERSRTLLLPDPEQGEIKLFNFDPEASQLSIDPAKYVYSIKLVVPLKGNSEEFVTVKQLENVMPRVITRQNNLIRYVERCDSWPKSLCGCQCRGCVMLAIDGEWLKTVPESMQFVVTDLIAYFMRHPYSLDTSRSIKSESVDGHSVSYDNAETIDSIINTLEFAKMVSDYAGPFSPYYKKVRLT